MARLRLTKLPDGNVRVGVVEQIGGAEVEYPIEGCANVMWQVSPGGSCVQLTFVPQFVSITEELHPVEQALNDSDAQSQAN